MTRIKVITKSGKTHVIVLHLLGWNKPSWRRAGHIYSLAVSLDIQRERESLYNVAYIGWEVYIQGYKLPCMTVGDKTSFKGKIMNVVWLCRSSSLHVAMHCTH